MGDSLAENPTCWQHPPRSPKRCPIGRTSPLPLPAQAEPLAVDIPLAAEAKLLAALAIPLAWRHTPLQEDLRQLFKSLLAESAPLPAQAAPRAAPSRWMCQPDIDRSPAYGGLASE